MELHTVKPVQSGRSLETNSGFEYSVGLQSVKIIEKTSVVVHVDIIVG